ncbi:unnamed protein product [Meloidogyne enterolobii]|uniref:Uncharacterized protein n=1 Tax=Meloidogyne enterolobii TaxID=390850 RepID=A0ACB1A148_MELEN
MKIYRQNNKEKLKEDNRKYREANKEKRRESGRKYREDNKERLKESNRKYRENNKEKLTESNRKYKQNNKEKRREADRNYSQNNKEKRKEYFQNYREKMKNKKENLKNVDPKVGNIHSDNNEGTSFVNTQNSDVRNKGKLPIIYEERIQFEIDPSNQEEEESKKGETEAHSGEQNQTVVEEPNKISGNCTNHINLNEYPFDLNEKPEDNDENVC